MPKRNPRFVSKPYPFLKYHAASVMLKIMKNDILFVDPAFLLRRGQRSLRPHACEIQTFFPPRLFVSG
jgi:hypothetical protein